MNSQLIYSNNCSTFPLGFPYDTSNQSPNTEGLAQPCSTPCIFCLSGCCHGSPSFLGQNYGIIFQSLFVHPMKSISRSHWLHLQNIFKFNHFSQPSLQSPWSSCLNYNILFPSSIHVTLTYISHQIPRVIILKYEMDYFTPSSKSTASNNYLNVTHTPYFVLLYPT